MECNELIKQNVLPVYGQIKEDHVLLGNIVRLYHEVAPSFNSYSEVKKNEKETFIVTLNELEVVDNSDWKVSVGVYTPDGDYYEFKVNSEIITVGATEYVVESVFNI